MCQTIKKQSKVFDLMYLGFIYHIFTSIKFLAADKKKILD
jgi:hypothetical protein